MIKCPNCTAQLEFKPTDKKVFCGYCGSSFNPLTLKLDVNVADEKTTKEVVNENITNQVVEPKETIDATSYNCTNCGASLLVFDDTAVTFCNYCGSSNMIKSKLIKQTKPDLIIPFSIDKNKCIELYKKKIKKNIFAPKYMLEEMSVNNFRGIYMPYEVYNFKAFPKITATGEKYYKTRGNYDYYHIYTITGDLNGFVKGIGYDGVSKFYDKYSEAISPYKYQEAVEFNPSYISGFYADSLDVKENLYSARALVNAEYVAEDCLKKDKRFGQHGCHNPKARLDLEDKKVAMYPVYFLGLKDKSGENIHYAVINGQTGKVAMDIPIDYKKYIIVSLILSVFLYFGYSLLTMDINTPLYISMAAAIITFALSLSITSSLTKHDTLEQDVGYSSKNAEDVALRKSKKNGFSTFFTVIKPIMAFIIPCLVFFSSLTNDIYYYGAAIISCLLILWNFYDIVVKYNKLSRHKIPQLEKRGGDDR